MKNLTIDEFKELITQNTWTHEMSIDSNEIFERIVEGGATHRAGPGEQRRAIN
ncbi:hypothetical protein [Oligella sp. HMSC09E12]|uniref:hypothetical protein n=1 Tax=Oligella sp. HMSC09E12 TaxID=1581147 RepID=UPI0014397C42|nr:hypothetical protein [Oligella sp. HMSC09E12]